MKSAFAVISAITGALSLFKLNLLLRNNELSAVMEKVLEAYDKLLSPVRKVVGPLLRWILEHLDYQLPEWWIHVFVIWIVLGGIAARTGLNIDKKTGEAKKGNAIASAIGSLILPLYGPFIFLFAIFTWIRYEIMLSILAQETGENYREDERYVSGFKELLREIGVTIGLAIGFIVFNSFA